MSVKPIAVSVKDLSKSFRIPLEASSGIKQKIINLIKGRKGYREFTPLNDISFEIEEGEFFGIVGRNGSGKSTLLKTIAGIYTPDKGAVRVNGTLVPFIELGVGFNPELTGRENVFLNGALLGFSHDEVDAMYDEIVDFAEISDFMDEKLKNYSSGMQVRLAFSIAIRAKGDVLILDEVLAVGDQAFQQKCYSYFANLKKEKKTVVLVTHDMGAVKQFCDKALILENGNIKTIGAPHEVALEYDKLNFASSPAEVGQKDINSSVEIRTLNTNNKPTTRYKYGEDIILSATWPKELAVGIVGFMLIKNGECVFATNTIGRDANLSKGTSQLRLKPIIGDGRYKITVGLFGKNRHDVLEFKEGPEIVVYDQPEHGDAGDEWQGITYIENDWI